MPCENISFSFSLIDESYTIKIIDSLKPKSSYGSDFISNKLLKYLKIELSKPITKIINQCFQSGSFPDKLKIAKVIPLYKKKDDTLLENYRPVSVLSSVSKVFERTIYNQIYQYFSDHNLFYKSQYGFRRNHSTEFATIELIDNIISEMDNKEVPLNIYLDLSKAFDTLDHSILLTKLKHYGINGIAHDLVRSYLTNRFQYIEFNNTQSKLLPIKTGVPQGSILGPLLFIIYVNDLSNVSNIFYPIIYADDTTLITTLKTIKLYNNSSNIDTVLNNELCKISNWLKLNKLSLNCEKTKAMIFHTPQRIITYPKIQVNGHNIEFVREFNFLGIIIDEHLSWKPHTTSLSNKLSKTVGIMSRLKNFLPSEALLNIYNSLIVSHLNYGIFLWGERLGQLTKLQKKAVRIISKSKYNAHTSGLFRNLKVIKLDDINTIHNFKICYKLYNSLLPESLSTIIFSNEHQTRYATRRRDQQNLPLQFVKHDFAKQSFRYRIPIIFNNMNDSIRSKIFSHSFIGYKIYIKKFFINSYSVECNIVNCYICSLNQ